MTIPLEGRKVVISGAGRDFGRTLSICLARLGAEVFLSGRNESAIMELKDTLSKEGDFKIHANVCDLNIPASIANFSREVSKATGHIDILVNNGAAWLEGDDIESADDDQIIETITSGAAGLVLLTKHFLPLLRSSDNPDIVNMVSSAALSDDFHCRGHVAFYASKGAQGRAAQLLSHRLRKEGIRVISLYPPDFTNVDPLDPAWSDPRTDTQITSRALVECIVFAISQPRDCFIRSFEFERY